MYFVATYYGKPDSFLHELDAPALALLRYWQNLQSETFPPLMDDFDPLEVTDALSRAVLVGADESGRLSYRVVGTQEAQDRGRDATGKIVGEEYFGASRERVLLQYQLVMETKDACCNVYRFRPLDEERSEDVSLYLPFCNPAGETRFVLVYSYCRAIEKHMVHPGVTPERSVG